MKLTRGSGSRGPQAPRDRQQRRGRARRPDPHREDQRADAVRSQGIASRIQHWPRASDRQGLAGAGPVRDVRQIHAVRRGAVRMIVGVLHA
jgi:hypothetical protein